MNNILLEKKYPISARLLVPAATQPGAPVSLRLQSQNPILAGFKVWIYSADADTFSLSGIQLLSNGQRILPTMGSNDDASFVTSANFAPIPSNNTILEEDNINIQLGGSPYDLEIKAYNTDAVNLILFFIFDTCPKVNLPLAEIQKDELEKKQEPIN